MQQELYKNGLNVFSWQ